MSARRLPMTDALCDYVQRVGVRESPLLARLRQETAALPMAGMQIGADQGQFMTLLLRLMGARRAIEIGVFTGYSSLCIALGLSEPGELIACDVSEEYTAVARRYWKEAAVEQRVHLRLQPALRTLAELHEQGRTESFDFAFIDADKENGLRYFEACLGLVRPGGLVAIDNALWGGSVASTEDQRASTVAIRQLNEHVCHDPRVEATLLTLGDGLLLARKR